MTSDRPRPRAFTLLELLVVVLLVGLVGAVIAAGVVRSSAGARRLAAMNAVVSELTTARIEAMRTSRPRTVSVFPRDSELAITSGDRPPQALTRPGVAMLDEQFKVVASLRATFDRDGRTRARRWSFLPLGAGQKRPEPGGSARLAPGTILWRIDFDPVSGAVGLTRAAVEQARPDDSDASETSGSDREVGP